MRSVEFLGAVVALASSGYAQGTKQVCDTTTKICYQTYVDSMNNIQFGIALPNNPTYPYDALVQVVAPKATPWVGFAWGGDMIYNPLFVSWPNGASVVTSSRFATNLALPQPYPDAEYSLLKGSGSNSTHWYVQALCSGCSGWQGIEASLVTLNSSGTHQFAWAVGGAAVDQPSNNQSTFNIHQMYGKWDHDLKAAQNSQFQSWVSANRLPKPGGSAAPSVSQPAATSGAVTSRVATSSATSRPVSRSASVKPPTNTQVPSAAIPASCSGAGSFAFQSVLASGWKATKVIGGLSSPRQVIFDPSGNMLVLQAGKGITAYTMGADGCSTASKSLVSQSNLNHGIQVSADGKYLYASSQTQVYRWSYDPASAAVSGSSSVVVKGMMSGIHSTRTLQFSNTNPNLLAVSHGSNDNWDYATGNPATGRSVVRIFDVSNVPSGGFNWLSDGWLGGYGMRNEVGIAFDPNGHMWGVENSGDQFQRTINGKATDVHIDNPAEELNYIGDVSKENKNWFGYPTCFTVWSPSQFTDTKFQVGDQFVVTPNSTYKDSNCKDSSHAPALSFQAHSAPIDMKFDADSSNLYITFHGSWNRSPTTGFKLINVPFTKGADGNYRPKADPNSATGWEDIARNPDVTKCQGNGPAMSSGCFRPAGIGFDKSGRLYMTSDTQTNGEIWVLGKS